MNVQKIREDFPILKRLINGKPLVYFDNSATTQKPASVIAALNNYYSTINANIHRGVHKLAEEATEAYEKSRAKTANWIHAPDAHTIIFTRNCTESINLVAAAWGRKFLKPGDEILLTELEHHSNLVPWHFLKVEKGIVLKFIPIDEKGRLMLQSLPQLLSPKTKLVSLTQMSNALGTINPVKEIIAAARRVGALTLVDAAQSVPHRPVDVQDLNCDFLAFSPHKMLGPTGVGVLYGKREHLEAMNPYMGGGEMIREVWLDHSTYNQIPWKFEAGTPNIGDVIAFAEALRYLEKVGIQNIFQHELELAEYGLTVLSKIDGLTLYGPKSLENRGGIISFNLKGIHPHDTGTVLDQEGIAVRAGHHCAQPLMRKLGISGTTRASFYLYNTKEEIDTLVKGIHRTFEVFQRVAAR